MLYVLAVLTFFIAPVWAILWTLDEHPDKQRHGRRALALYAVLMVGQLAAWMAISSIASGSG